MENASRLEHLILPFDFRMIGRTSITIHQANPENLDERLPDLNIFMTNEPLSIYCVRWSHQPDLIAGTPYDETGIEKCKEDALKLLKDLYRVRGVTWPAPE